MNIITLDFETYFDSVYSLSKLSTESYVRDPRFAIHGVAIRQPDRETIWLDAARWRAELDRWRSELNASAVLCHHAHFDGLILNHHFDIRPAIWLDTLSMSRLLLGNHVSHSLDGIRLQLGMPAKRTPYDLFKGKHWRELDAPTQAAIAAGACDEVESIYSIFNRFMTGFPADELPLIDLTVRMFTEPMLQADINILSKVWIGESERKTALLEALGVKSGDLQSAARFAGLLRDAGVDDLPLKHGKNGVIYCFARTDDFMRELLEDSSERVRTLAQARLAVKSTIDQTRAYRLGDMAQRGAVTVYLNYAGTHTSLWSGGDGINYQNFRRDGELRKALRAPAGYLVAKIDQSQVQCRLVNWLAGQHDVIERFRRGEDPYIGIASIFYGRPITAVDKAERGTGKQLELSCGFGSGAETIRRTAKRGTYGPPVDLSEHAAVIARDLYRLTHPRVVALWHQANATLARMGGEVSFDWLDILEVRGNTILLPGGLPIHWPELQWDNEWQSFKFLQGKKYWRRIWGGFLIQNIVSALASVLVRTAMRKIQRAGLRIVLQEHDAVGVLVLDDANANATLEWLIDVMRCSPDWAPDLPLNAEGSLAETYS